MSRFRVLTVDDASLFAEMSRSALSTDPDSFPARLETDAWSKLETARQRFSTATPFAMVGLDVVGALGLVGSAT